MKTAIAIVLAGGLIGIGSSSAEWYRMKRCESLAELRVLAHYPNGPTKDRDWEHIESEVVRLCYSST